MKLSELPAVHEILVRLDDEAQRYPRELLVHEVRQAIAAARAALVSNRDAELAPVEETVRRRLAELEAPSLRRVINATGVVLHTNLGRAPLARLETLAGYSNLEYDLETGRRGKRDAHLAGLLERLLGAPGIAVNNNAAAVYLALNELAAGGEAIVSRGELVEIGEGFRIPDIMARSGAVLREVGSTNKTSVGDYRAAITDQTRLIMAVHPSNFRMTGFTSRPSRRELAELGRECGIPVYEDLGSGCVADLRDFGIKEPRPQESLADGVDLLSFSGDKLLGGPQAGILTGRPELVERLRRNPMYRALRLDKLISQALAETLRRLLLGREDEIPALRMIREPAERIRERAERLLAQMPRLKGEVIEGESVIGGGSTPDQPIATWLIAIASGDVTRLETELRRHTPPVIARIENDRLLVDLRTVFPEEEAELAAALQALS